MMRFRIVTGFSVYLFEKGLKMKNSSVALIGGTVITMDGRFPRCEGILVENGRISAVGDDSTISRLADEKRIKVIDLDGRTAVPGLHDCHVHVMGTGANAHGVDLFDAGSIRVFLTPWQKGRKRRRKAG